MSKLYTFTILCLFSAITLTAQQYTLATHYSADDGLSENHVLSMLQDSKGLMWFGTYKGLDSFDGYTFTNYKDTKEHPYHWENQRIDRIKEDMQGFLWVQTYDYRYYRFDPKTERFLPIPQCNDQLSGFDKSLNRIFFLADSSIWLYGTDGASNGCFKIKNNPNGGVDIWNFTAEKGHLPANKINKVFLDNQGNTWLLTSKGPAVMKPSELTPKPIGVKHPNNELFSFARHQLNLYMGGEKGLLLVADANNKPTPITTHIEGNIIDIQTTKTDELCLITNTPTIYLFNTTTRALTPFTLTIPKNQTVYGSYKDSHNRLWIDTEYDGAICYNAVDNTILYLSGGSQTHNITQKFQVIESKGNLWVQTRNGGFFRVNDAGNRLEPIITATGTNLSDIVHTAMADKLGNLWLSTYLQGLHKLVTIQSPFTFIRPVTTPSKALSNEIRSVMEDSRKWLWVGTKPGYVFVYDDKRQLLGNLCADGDIGSQNKLNINVYAMMEDQDGNIWLATKGMGIYRLRHLSGQKYSITNFRNDTSDPFSISSNAVYSMKQDSHGRTWIGTMGGGLNLMLEGSGNARFIHSGNLMKDPNIAECRRVRHVSIDLNDNLLLGTTQGLLVGTVNDTSPEKCSFEKYARQSANSTSLSGSDVQFVLPTKSGDVYLALLDGGLNVMKQKKGTKAPHFDQLATEGAPPKTIAHTMMEDANGRIWISNQTSITCYNPNSLKLDAYKPYSDHTYFFSEGAACLTHNGTIVYGTSDGLLTFDPSKIGKSDYSPRIVLNNLQILGEHIVVGNNGSPLTKTIDNTETLTLNHRQNAISISFAALDYADPDAIRYAYKLDGLDTDWHYAKNQRTATYNNLPKGSFTFRVKSTNADGQWANNERSINIIKQPSFWESNWGLLFYVILFLILSVVVAYVLFTIYRLRNEVTIEQRIADMKLRFFTDISHELRTPLTLIASPIDHLIRKEPLTASGREQLLMVQRNTQRLVRLINQLLDFRKVQSKKMKLVVESVLAADLSTEICSNFRKLADDKAIQLTVNDNTKNAQIWVDKDKFEKIFFNLLSNAFKFSPSGSKITLTIIDDNHHVHITINDQGTGIGKEHIKLLFDRFESFAATGISQQSSTGIGLSLTKELVELHHATISVDSEPGKGSTFTVSFKKGFDHFGDNCELLMTDTQGAALPTPIPADITGTTSQSTDINGHQANHRPRLLVADDNQELRQMMASALGQTYEVLLATNGRMALMMAQQSDPDLIISDIMMPDMNGHELAIALKDNIDTCHVPLIMLTAKTDLDSKLESMQLGVDDYITKPFSMTYLQARIDNLLKVRHQLQKFYQSSLTSGVITLNKPNITDLDELFLQKTMLFMEKHYGNCDINVDHLAESTGVSRSSFFKKIKSLTGLAPVDFIREFRLQKAVQLIDAGETNVAQLAYSVGINDARYFSRCFKQKHGVTPSEYMGR